ncbi:hypothetical protein FB451DRAFT_1177173 [Mycena latifolia]|nr:hypothetical protein FB451DRAFT_1177173 [Mycena latifolia]
MSDSSLPLAPYNPRSPRITRKSTAAPRAGVSGDLINLHGAHQSKARALAAPIVAIDPSALPGPAPLRQKAGASATLPLASVEMLSVWDGALPLFRRQRAPLPPSPSIRRNALKFRRISSQDYCHLVNSCARGVPGAARCPPLPPLLSALRLAPTVFQDGPRHRGVPLHSPSGTSGGHVPHLAPRRARLRVFPRVFQGFSGIQTRQYIKAPPPP